MIIFYKRLLVLLSLITALPVFSQTPMVFKGGGTGTNVIPLGSGTIWQNRRAQYLYTPTDLTNVQGGLINRIYFRTSSTGTSTYGSLTIRLTQNNMTTFASGAFVTPLTTVYTAPTTTITTLGGNWFFINLQTPFLYNPSQTLIVDVTTLTNTGTGISLFTTPSIGSKRLQGSPATATTGFADNAWNDFGFDVVPPDVGITALLNPVNNSCASESSPVRAIVRNYSSTTAASNVAVRCEVTGAITVTLSDTLRRTIPALGQDTVTFAEGINPFAGGNLNFRVFTRNASDPVKTNDTLVVSRLINSYPNSVQLNPSAQFQGSFVSGTIQNPDHVKAGDTLVYQFNAPAGFNNTQYGTSWSVINSAMLTDFGTSAQAFLFTAPSSGNGLLRFIPQSTETDSLFKLSIRVRIGATGCDTLLERYVYVAPVPVANFRASVACFGAPVQFTDSSRIIRGTLRYFWDFGDAGNADTSVLASPEYSYSASGSYTVTLRVTSNLGYSAQRTMTIDVGYVPQVRFTADNACDKSNVVFSNGTTIQGQLTNLVYDWDFGDGTRSSATNPVRMYATPGVYTVVLRATSPIGCTSTFTRQATVFPYPKADFDFSGSCQNEEIQFDNKSTVAFGTFGQRWDLGNGNRTNESDFLFAYTNAGTYQVKLKVVSEFGCADSITKQLVINPKPVVVFSAAEVCEGSSTMFSNNSTLTGSSTGFSSTWNFGDGVSQNSNAATLNYLYNEAGTYKVTLTATTGTCSSSAEQMVTVKTAPHAVFNTSGSTCAGSTIRFINASSNAATFTWNFGDAQTSTEREPVKAYNNSGTFEVSLIASGTNGCVDSAKKSVTVNALPNAAFTYNRNVPAQQRQVAFSPTEDKLDLYEWNMGDGNRYNQVTPVHSFLTNGPFKVVLTVTDVNGCENSSEQIIGFNVSTNQIASKSLNAYPNPAQDVLNVTGYDGVLKTAFITNALGQRIAIYFKEGAKEIEVELTSLPQGVYTLHLTTDGGNFATTFVKR